MTVLLRLLLETDTDEAGSSNSDKDIDTDINKGMMKTLLLHVGVKFIFCQGLTGHLEF
jgi:hypothetical protein